MICHVFSTQQFEMSNIIPSYIDIFLSYVCKIGKAYLVYILRNEQNHPMICFLSYKTMDTEIYRFIFPSNPTAINRLLSSSKNAVQI